MTYESRLDLKGLNIPAETANWLEEAFRYIAGMKRHIYLCAVSERGSYACAALAGFVAGFGAAFGNFDLAALLAGTSALGVCIGRRKSNEAQFYSGQLRDYLSQNDFEVVEEDVRHIRTRIRLTSPFDGSLESRVIQQ